ncbi:hypothetical protein CH282_15610 [Rhodococcus sp. 06-418-1B]|nr:enoyl-CoA hydratase/isomerase family protein [Rhodococcus sp. 06-418-1B]OZC83388.1 hypothetical protein CH282_15610 [Rhodococcus sp. 06-418-1B]
MTTLPALATLKVSWAASGVLLVTIDRAKSANTITAQVCRDLEFLAKFTAASTDARALVITGNGDRFFCAGADLRDPEIGPGWIEQARRSYDAFANLPIPTIAAVNGLALGGGTELTLACDARFSDPSAKFGLPEIKIGSLPGAGGMTRLQHVVGPSVARDMVFTGRQVTAKEALAIGLTDRISMRGESVTEAVAYATDIAQFAGYAIRAAKRSLVNAIGNPTSSSLTFEYSQFDHMATSDELAAEQRRAADRDPVYARIFAARA